MKTSELKYYLQRQDLIKRLAFKFAELNGYKIESNVDIQNSKHPRIRTWVLMAQTAVDEMDKELSSNLNLTQKTEN